MYKFKFCHSFLRENIKFASINIVVQFLFRGSSCKLTKVSKLAIYEGCSLILVICLIILCLLTTNENVVYIWSFLVRLVSKLLLSGTVLFSS